MQTQDYYTLPDRLHSELSLLACIVNDGRRFLEVYGTVKASDFSQPALAAAWDWMTALTDRGQKITLYALHQAYSGHPDWKTFLAFRNTPDTEAMPHLLHQYAADVAAHSRRAAMAGRISQLHSMATAGAATVELENEVQSLFQDSFSRSVSSSFRKADEIVDDIEARLANPKLEPRFRTGFRSLDAMLKGGFKGKQLCIVAGRTGGGKTVLAMNLAVQMALDGIPVACFSLEMSDTDLLMRCIMSEGVHRSEEAAMEAVRSLPLWVDETSNITARGISARIKLMSALKGVRVFVVDYLQLIEGDGHSRESRERIVAAMSRTLKLAAKENDVLVIALSQLNEDHELRESRAIEQDADAVLYVLDNPDGDWFLRLTKQRGGKSHGPIKRLKDKDPGIPIRFHAENFRFSE